MKTAKIIFLPSLFIFASLIACRAGLQASSTALPTAPAPTNSLITLPAATAITNPSTPSQALPETLSPSDTPIPTLTLTPSSPVSPTTPPLPLTELVIKIPAPSLAGNLLGEPGEQAVQIYLPPSYNLTARRYPVAYFLPGFGSNTTGGNQFFRTDEVAALMASGGIKEMILVVPNGANVLDGSFYVNSPVTGNWEDFILKDVVGYMDANYRTISKPEARGIGGHSMGGFGALYLAMRHPDIFSASYSLSPAFFNETGLDESQMFDTEKKKLNFQKQVESLGSLSEKDAVREMIKADGPYGFMLAYGAAFDPDPDHGPPFFDYPYELKNGKARPAPEQWQRWQAGLGDWQGKIAAYHANLASLRGIVIDYGVYDDLEWIQYGSEYVSKALTEAGIPNQIYRFEGDHYNRIEERILTVMLPLFSQVLVDPEGG